MGSAGVNRATGIAVAVAIAAFVLGVAGYLQVGGVSVATAIYDALALFTFTFAQPVRAHPSALPVALEVARSSPRP